MGKQRNTILILGEGPTEFFYFKSLCDELKGLTIKPDYPKHTSLKELEHKIEEGVSLGYNHIFCVIDMDTKDREPERSQYARLKKKYASIIDKPKKGIFCEVKFFETHLCTELFFLYYFLYFSIHSQSLLLWCSITFPLHSLSPILNLALQKRLLFSHSLPVSMIFISSPLVVMSLLLGISLLFQM